MTAQPLLAVENLSVGIGARPILERVSLEVRRGETLGLVGASGSGKSMTALSVMRLLPRAARMTGKVCLEDRPLVELSERELQTVRGSRVGMVFQEPMTALNPLIAIGEQVAETVRLHRHASRAEATALACVALDRVGLRGTEGDLERFPHELSGGQRQRVALAIALVLSPPLLIADEPTTALDVSTQAAVLRLLHELAVERGMGILFVSHDLAVISQITDRIAVMQEGRIVEQGPSHELLRSPQHPYTQALLAAASLAPKRPRTSTAAGAPVLEARDVVREYPQRHRALRQRPRPRRAVDRVSLELRAGETAGLVGESGSGKSSLLRTILALDRPQAGEVLVKGELFSAAWRTDDAKVARLRRSIQVVLQDPVGSFDPLWSVERLVAEPYHTLETRPSAAERKAAVAAVLEQVGLSATDAARYPHEFSGGQRQRIAIARALILKPAVIAFDEAVSALDVIVRAQILDLLANLAQQLELAYLFVSHDLNVVRSIADRVYVMERGRIVEHGPTERIFESPQHEYTRALLAATPRLGARLA